jgi:nitrogen regulatory protein P-II 1
LVAHLVTAIIKPFKLQEVKEALRGAALPAQHRPSPLTGLTVTDVNGYGRQGGNTEVLRGSEYKTEFVPKVKIEVLVESSHAYKVMDLIAAAARTGTIGDGKVWAHSVDHLIRTRTGEMGDDAV